MELSGCGLKDVTVTASYIRLSSSAMRLPEMRETICFETVSAPTPGCRGGGHATSNLAEISP